MDKKTYWKHYWSTRRGSVNSFAKSCMRFLSRRKDLRILDVGCGDGTESLFFASKGHRVTALDISESSIESLQSIIQSAKQLRVRPLLHDIRKKLPVRSASVDVVYAHLSLHYFNDRMTGKIFGDIHRVLKKGGFFFVRVKSTRDPQYGRGKKIEQDYFLQEHARHFFTKECLLQKLQGFRILHLRHNRAFYDDHNSCFIDTIAKKRG